MKSIDVYKNDPQHLYIIFNIADTLFTVSSQYISDIQYIPDNITRLSHSPDYCSVGNSYGRVVDMLDLEAMMYHFPKNDISQTDFEKSAISSKKMLVILFGEPFRGLLVNQIYSIEQKHNLRIIERNAFITDYIDNVYLHKLTGRIIMELNIPRILTMFADTE